MELIRLRTKIFKPNFDLFEGILEAITRNKQTLKEKDILVVNSKIVAVSQGRVRELESKRNRELENKGNTKSKIPQKSHYGTGTEDPRFTNLVMQEADTVIPGSMLLTIKNGIFTPAAGIDRSNSPQGTVVLWPDSPWETAWELRAQLKAHYELKKLGVIIVDSTCQPLRSGTSGVALSWAGFEGVEDARGVKDIYGKPLTVTKKAVADNLACAAQLLMGEAAEKVPLVLARNVPTQFSQKKPKKNAGTIKPDACLYAQLYTNLI